MHPVHTAGHRGRCLLFFGLFTYRQILIYCTFESLRWRGKALQWMMDDKNTHVRKEREKGGEVGKEGEEKSMVVGVGSVVHVDHINDRRFIIIRAMMDTGETAPPRKEESPARSSEKRK